MGAFSRPRLSVLVHQFKRRALLTDPRLMRGWCMGPPRANWFSAGPDGWPMIEFLATLSTLRMQEWVAVTAEMAPRRQVVLTRAAARVAVADVE